ncbi:MAG TPA: ATP-binding cassette domain-containing protein [Ktedonosporobacter sp.]|nr:ATP-binding cassette domain-containing protein [Ktedonosporobacter sp.]
MGQGITARPLSISELPPGSFLPIQEKSSTRDARMKIEVHHLSAFFGKRQVLHQVSFDVQEQRITTLLGPSGSGKSTLLRTLARLHDSTAPIRLVGRVLLDGEDIYTGCKDPTQIHRQVGLLFEQPHLFPTSIFENVAYGLRLLGAHEKGSLHRAVQWTLQRVGLWEEVKDRLTHSAWRLSEGQQYRLCLARALIVEPEVLLLDEPSHLEASGSKPSMLELLMHLKETTTIVVATSNPRFACQVSDHRRVIFEGTVTEMEAAPKSGTFPEDWWKEAF